MVESWAKSGNKIQTSLKLLHTTEVPTQPAILFCKVICKYIYIYIYIVNGINDSMWFAAPRVLCSNLCALQHPFYFVGSDDMCAQGYQLYIYVYLNIHLEYVIRMQSAGSIYIYIIVSPQVNVVYIYLNIYI